MKPSHLLFLPLALAFHLDGAFAEIYKRVDADGHVTYSSTPLKGGKKLHLEPLPTMPPPAIPPQRARNSESPSDFPRVDASTQRSRDNTRRQILEDELTSETKALDEARRNLKEGMDAPETFVGKDGKTYRNVAKYEEKVRSLQDEVQLHEKNIEALKTELSNLNR